MRRTSNAQSPEVIVVVSEVLVGEVSITWVGGDGPVTTLAGSG
jgi:hypothetical protein